MTLDYLLPALWGCVLIVSFVGYGALLRRLLFGLEEVGWANEAAWGMAFLIVLSGLLSYLYAISRPLILVLVTTGFVLAVGDAVIRRVLTAIRLSSFITYIQKHPYAFAFKALGYGCIIVLAGIQYLHSITGIINNDDIKGYFPSADQLLELGGFAADWFNGYRLYTGLGGQAVLDAMMLALFDYKNLTLIDDGVALIICVGLVWRIGQEKRLAYPLKWALALFPLTVPFYPTLAINCSSFSTGMVMFLALFLFLDRDTINDETPIRNALLVSLLAASACAFKTNLIPPCMLILVLSYLWHVRAQRFKKEAITEALLVPIFVFLMLLPWMLSLLRSSGTMLYPILGTGFDEFNYGNYLSEDYAGGLSLGQKLAVVFGNFLSRDIYLFLAIAGTVAFVVLRIKRRAAVHSFSLGSLLAAVIIMLKSDISNSQPFFRYLFVCVFVSLIAVLSALMKDVSQRVALKQSATLRQYGAAVFADRMTALAFITLLATGAAFFGYYQFAGPSAGDSAPVRVGHALEMYRTFLDEIPKEMGADGTPLFKESWRERYRRAQESVPAGEPILSRDLATILYDYGRNPIYTLNDPGSCSPPPGMPYFQGPEAVAAYLLSHNIRYVAYAYAEQAGYPVVDNLWRLKPDRPYGHRITERAKVALDRVLGELGVSRRRIYDDGSLFILDLKTPAAVPETYREPNYFQIGKILSLAWAQTQGFDTKKVWTDGHGVIEDIHYDPEAKDSILVLNTFGYHPWKGDMNKLKLALSINGKSLPFVEYSGNAYSFSLASVRGPITNITIDSATFVPRNEKVRFGMDDDRKTLGIDVDTIEIVNRERR